MDSGSQFSYISPEAREKLKLKTVGTSEVVVKTFGNKSETKTLERVEFAVKSKNGLFNIYLEAFVSNICLPLENQLLL